MAGNGNCKLLGPPKNNESVIPFIPLKIKEYSMSESQETTKEIINLIATSNLCSYQIAYKLGINKRTIDKIGKEHLVLKITKVIRQYHAKLIRLLYQKKPDHLEVKN